MNHSRVAADDHGTDLVRVHARLAADVIQQGVQGVHGDGLQFFSMFGIVLCIENPAENLVTIGPLAVADRVLGQNAAGGEIHQPHNHGGTAQIHGGAVGTEGGITGFHAGHIPVAAIVNQRHGESLQAQRLVGRLHQLQRQTGVQAQGGKGIETALDVVGAVCVQVRHVQASFLYPRVLHQKIPISVLCTVRFVVLYFCIMVPQTHKKDKGIANGQKIWYRISWNCVTRS